MKKAAKSNTLRSLVRHPNGDRAAETTNHLAEDMFDLVTRERAEGAEREGDVARSSLKAVIENGGAGERLDKVVRERDAMRAALRTIRDYEIDWRIDVAPNVENLRAIAENALGEEAT